MKIYLDLAVKAALLAGEEILKVYNDESSDFGVEYTGQIRCWFYYLHVLSVALFDKPAYKNCVVHGTVLAKDGKKNPSSELQATIDLFNSDDNLLKCQFPARYLFLKKHKLIKSKFPNCTGISKRTATNIHAP